MSNLIMTDAVYTASSSTSFGQSLSGGDGIISNGSSPLTESTTSFTIEFRMTQNGASSLSLMVSQQNFFWIGVSSAGKPEIRYGASPNEVAMSPDIVIADGNEHHIALSVGDSGGSAFVDGVLVGSDATTLSDATPLGDKYFGIRKSFVGSSEAVIDEVVVWDFDRYTSDFTAPTVPYTGDETGLLGLYHLDGNGVDSTGNTVPVDPDPDPDPDPVDGEILPSNSGILYSPYNWVVNSGFSKTINPGAYFKIFAKTGSCTLNFDVSGYNEFIPRVLISVDGVTYQEQDITSSVAVDIPANTTYSKHIIEVILDSATEYEDRWDTNQSAMVLTSIQLDSDAEIYTPERKPNTLLIYGDSITEGVKSRGSAGNWVAKNSAKGCYPLTVRENTNSEIGIIGFGGSGINSYGGGGVPRLKDSYDMVYDGAVRDFTDEPDLCVWLEGTNDGTGDTVANGITALNGMMTDMPNTKFLILRPLNGTKQEQNLKDIISGSIDPSRATYRSTEGFFDSSDASDGLHPYSYAHQGTIGYGISGLVNEELGSTDYTGDTSTATITIEGIPNGTYRTILSSEDGRSVFDGYVTYSDGSGSAAGVESAAGSDLIGAIVDNNNPHASGAVVSVTTS